MGFPPWTIRSSITTYERVCRRPQQPEVHDFSRVYFTWHSFAIFNILGGITWSSVFVGLGYFFGGIPFVSEHFELIVVGIVAVSVIPALAAAIKAKIGSSSPVPPTASPVEE